MPIVVRSPFSGQPVKIRDQDVGRAVRDEEGRVFYVVPFVDGSGFYGSPTRHGGPKEEDRYRRQLDKDTTLTEYRKDTAPARPEVVHDATGRRKTSPVRLLVLLVVLALLGAAGYAGWQYWQTGSLPRIPRELPDVIPGDPELPPTMPVPDVPEVPDVPRVPPELPGVSESEVPGDEQVTPSVRGRIDPVEMILAGGSPARDGLGVEPQARDDDGRIDPVSFALPPRIAARFTPQPQEQPPHPRVDPLTSLTAGNIATPPATITTISAPALTFDERTFDPKRYRPTVSGLSLREGVVGNGPSPQTGDYVLVQYTVRLIDGRVIDSTKPNEPFGFVLWSGQAFRGMDEGIAGMRAGGKRELLMPAEWLTGPRPQNQSLENVNLAHVEVELLAVLPGLKKVRLAPGAGRIAQPGDTVTMHWTLWAGDRDQPFSDTRSAGQPVTVDLGGGDVIPGLELGITGLVEGEVVELRIPSYLAYGAAGAAGGLVPPHTPLRAQIELVKVGQP
jgi:FKBP-type peptidyl-prolyl cis-trans isomerase